jgi:hypothetical protein
VIDVKTKDSFKRSLELCRWGIMAGPSFGFALAGLQRFLESRKSAIDARGTSQRVWRGSLCVRLWRYAVAVSQQVFYASGSDGVLSAQRWWAACKMASTRISRSRAMRLASDVPVTIRPLASGGNPNRCLHQPRTSFRHKFVPWSEPRNSSSWRPPAFPQRCGRPAQVRAPSRRISGTGFLWRKEESLF